MVVEKVEADHVAHPRALELGVDIVGDPHREDDDGFNWTRLHFARKAGDVVPGSTIIMGSSIGKYLARVVAWDFEVSDTDPIVLMELLPVSPEEAQAALDRTAPSSSRRLPFINLMSVCSTKRNPVVGALLGHASISAWLKCEFIPFGGPTDSSDGRCGSAGTSSSLRATGRKRGCGRRACHQQQGRWRTTRCSLG